MSATAAVGDLARRSIPGTDADAVARLGALLSAQPGSTILVTGAHRRRQRVLSAVVAERRPAPGSWVHVDVPGSRRAYTAVAALVSVLARTLPQSAMGVLGELHRDIDEAAAAATPREHRLCVGVGLGSVVAAWSRATPGATLVLDGIDDADEDSVAVLASVFGEERTSGAGLVVGTLQERRWRGEAMTALIWDTARPRAVVACAERDAATSPPGVVDLPQEVMAHLAMLGPVQAELLPAVADHLGVPVDLVERAVDEAAEQGRLDLDAWGRLTLPPRERRRWHAAALAVADSGDLLWRSVLAAAERRSAGLSSDPLAVAALLATCVRPGDPPEIADLLVVAADVVAVDDPVTGLRWLEAATQVVTFPERALLVRARQIPLLEASGQWTRAAQLGRRILAEGGELDPFQTLAWAQALTSAGLVDEAVEVLAQVRDHWQQASRPWAPRRTSGPTGSVAAAIERPFRREDLSRIGRHQAQALIEQGLMREALAVLHEDVRAVDPAPQGRSLSALAAVLLVGGWGDGEQFLRALELLRECGPLPAGVRRRDWLEAAREAACASDLATAAAYLRGDSAPPIRAADRWYAQLRHDVLRGAWSEALRAGQSLTLPLTVPGTVPGDGPVPRRVVHFSWGQLAHVHFNCGRPQEAAALLARVPEGMSLATGVESIRVRVLAATADAETAVEHARSMIDCYEGAGYTQGLDLLHASLIDVDPDPQGRARAAADLAQLQIRSGSLRSRFFAALAAAQVHDDVAAAVEAARLAERRTSTFDRARAQLELGRLAGSSPTGVPASPTRSSGPTAPAGDRSDVASPSGDDAGQMHLRAAFEAFRDVGATPWKDRAGQELETAGQPLPRRRASQDKGEVEARLVDLVAAGRTNREIARALFVSEKTIEGMLTRLFARTGVRSRVALVTATLHESSGGGTTTAVDDTPDDRGDLVGGHPRPRSILAAREVTGAHEDLPVGGAPRRRTGSSNAAALVAAIPFLREDLYVAAERARLNEDLQHDGTVPPLWGDIPLRKVWPMPEVEGNSGA